MSEELARKSIRLFDDDLIGTSLETKASKSKRGKGKSRTNSSKETLGSQKLANVKKKESKRKERLAKNTQSSALGINSRDILDRQAVNRIIQRNVGKLCRDRYNLAELEEKRNKKLKKKKAMEVEEAEFQAFEEEYAASKAPLF